MRKKSEKGPRGSEREWAGHDLLTPPGLHRQGPAPDDWRPLTNIRGAVFDAKRLRTLASANVTAVRLPQVHGNCRTT